MAWIAVTAVAGEVGPVLCLTMLVLFLLGLCLINTAVILGDLLVSVIHCSEPWNDLAPNNQPRMIRPPIVQHVVCSSFTELYCYVVSLTTGCLYGENVATPCSYALNADSAY
jgi:hypothetical protein